MAAAVHSLLSFDSNSIHHCCETLVNITHRPHLQREHLGEKVAHGGDRDEYDLGSLDSKEPPVFWEVPVPADRLPYLPEPCLKDRIGVLQIAHRVIELLIRPEASLLVHDVRHFVFPRDSDDSAIGTNQGRAVVEKPSLQLLVDSGKDVDPVLLGFARNSVDGWAGNRLRFSEEFSVDILGEVNRVEEFRKADDVGLMYPYGLID